MTDHTLLTVDNLLIVIALFWASNSILTYLMTKDSFKKDLYFFRHNRHEYKLTFLEAFFTIFLAPIADWVNYLYLEYLQKKYRGKINE